MIHRLGSYELKALRHRLILREVLKEESVAIVVTLLKEQVQNRSDLELECLPLKSFKRIACEAAAGDETASRAHFRSDFRPPPRFQVQLKVLQTVMATPPAASTSSLSRL